MSDSSPDRSTVANLPVYLLRCLAATAEELGVAPARLCMGLGFTVEDLSNPACRVSYRQGSLMIRRALQMAPGQALGLRIGESETIASIGLLGYAMMTCRTLGDATALGMGLQKFAGSMLQFDMEPGPTTTRVQASNRFPDPEIYVFLVEEAFASFLQIARGLVGNSFRPERIELAYPAPAYAAEYRRVFGCPVLFDQPSNALVAANDWVAKPLLTYDPLSHRQALEFLDVGTLREQDKVDLFESVERAVRQNMQDLPTLADVAGRLHLSARTLRRRLADSGVSYQTLLDNVRKGRAIELLSNTAQSVEQIAIAVGFSDAHNFRRAFKRWTGSAPSELRESMMQKDASARA
ncbi:AraC family transcriptional regulator [Roseateles violae]|uniref:AraC family transcriptional regulator n=1 Tax=Roseateles violae TaxID=3058042 RepID=A0ABT8DYB0_9BURK|nr:AraC family transcriptional regulator [Pelomonas sp. PFR6]MDN3922364.1 AraC family transcriptional regulator [Pelomonas sp. PFR6]